MVRLGTYEYVPFVREGVKWGYDECYRFDGDTVVGGVSYKKCYVSESCPFEEGQTLYGLAREEDRVVYCRAPAMSRRQYSMISASRSPATGCLLGSIPMANR